MISLIVGRALHVAIFAGSKTPYSIDSSVRRQPTSLEHEDSKSKTVVFVGVVVVVFVV